MPLGGARGQNLGHLCNTVLKFFKFLYLDSLLIEHSYLEFGYLDESSEIPKEHTPGFIPQGGPWGGARGQNLGHICKILYAYRL